MIRTSPGKAVRFDGHVHRVGNGRQGKRLLDPHVGLASDDGDDDVTDDDATELQSRGF